MTAASPSPRRSSLAALLPESWSHAQKIFFLGALAVGLAWSAFVMFASTGCSLDDELAHYLRSRSVWENPTLIFDSWTRTGRNLFHVLPAHFGLTVARLWTLAFAGLAVVFSALLAARLGVRRAWLTPLVLCFQPWFVELSWGVLTQTPFMLALVAGILALASRRLILSGLCFGALPLIRHEGIALTGLWVALLAIHTLATRAEWRRPLLALIFCAAPLAAYNLAAWICLGDLPSRIFFAAKPTEIYGHGPLWHFVPISILPAGVFTLILGAIGLPAACRAWRTTWPLLFFPAYFGLHSIVYWKGLFASAGYYHFLMPLAPGLAVVALLGVDALLDRSTVAARRVAVGLLAGVVLQGLLLVHLWRDPSHPRFTLQRDPIATALDAALAWQKKERPHVAVLVSRHVYVAFREDWIETPLHSHLSCLPPADLPAGSLVIWENKYSDLNGMSLAVLQSDPTWHQRVTFDSDAVRIFEKAP